MRPTKDDRAAVLSLSLIALIAFFPEYCAPFLSIGSLIAAASDAKRRGSSLMIGKFGQMLCFYFLYMAIGILYSDHRLNSASTLLMWVVMFCCYLSVVTVVHNRRRIRQLLFLIAVVSSVVALIGIGQFFITRVVKGIEYTQLWYPLDDLFYRLVPLDIVLAMAPDRISSTFTNPNIFAEYLVMVIPLVGLYAFDGKRTREQLVIRFGLFSAVIAAMLSFSRGAYLALLAILLLVILTNLRKLTPILLCLVAAVSLVPEAIIARFLSIGNTADGSIMERFDTWEVAFEVILQKPLFGLGPGVSNFWECLRQNGINAPHAHNLFLQLMVEGGLVALFLWILIGSRSLYKSMELLNHSPRTHASGIAFLSFCIAIIVYGMVEFPFLCPKLIGTFMMVLGLIQAVCAVHLREEPVPLFSRWRRS